MSLMRNSMRTCNFLLISLILVGTTLVSSGQNVTKEMANNNNNNNSSKLPIFVFGDSTVDPGNNNYIQTIFKSDFPPYGLDFPHQSSTGRFTNGRLPTDFIASYIGTKEIIPAYLDPNLSMEDLITGVSFASAGTGYDPATAEKNKVFNLEAQLQFFDEYKDKLQQVVGKKRMEYNIKHAVFLISCGSNDLIYTFGLDYFPLVPEKFGSYLNFLRYRNKWFLKALEEKGARVIVVVGLPPVGCLPIITTLHSSPFQQRSCFEPLSSMAMDLNKMLQQEVNLMQASQPNSIIIYGDIYGPLQDQFNNPSKYGFEVVDTGCCGTGLFEVSNSCNSKSLICNYRSKYLFWDAIHPTETSYYFIFQDLRPVLDSILRVLRK